MDPRTDEMLTSPAKANNVVVNRSRSEFPKFLVGLGEISWDTGQESARLCYTTRHVAASRGT